eukprot:TRINITY_DN6568_c1_g1_i2.p1 TRINITY_DN6568_c1_g1~~TRINITY_DN6568_c1_g1_i2.p1  ORF type:complete len:144 (-),score=28.39 TRINITY_DN6568_c1_g1_i2:112-543(-)
MTLRSVLLLGCWLLASSFTSAEAVISHHRNEVGDVSAVLTSDELLARAQRLASRDPGQLERDMPKKADIEAMLAQVEARITQLTTDVTEKTRMCTTVGAGPAREACLAHLKDMKAELANFDFVVKKHLLGILRQWPAQPPSGR